MFPSIAARIPADKELPERAWKLDVLRRVLDGTLYDSLPYQFFQELRQTGEYIPIAERQPAVRSNLCRVVVEDTTSLVFGEGRAPTIYSEDEATREGLLAICKDAKIQQAMLEAAIRGSIGSVAILLRVLNGRVFLKVMDTVTLTPTWDPDEPDKLLSVQEHYRVRGQVLKQAGYEITPDMLHMDFWFRRIWTAMDEVWHQPLPVQAAKDGQPFVRDEVRTVNHQLGFCPVVWIKNLPGPSATGDQESDGTCTFRPAVETQIEIDYQMSQAGRGLKYSSDPTLLIKEPAGDGTELVKSAGNALVVSKDGDAKILEIDGTASAAVIEYCKFLREMALEATHGNRANADKLSVAHSGRALEMLYHPLVSVADKLRASYGEDALLHLACMIVEASQKYPLKALGKPVKLSPDAPLSLRWPHYFPPAPADRQMQAQTLGELRKDGLLSRETAVGSLASTYDIEDVGAEITRIEADEQAQDARLAAERAQVKASETVED